VLESAVIPAPSGETGNAVRDALRELSSEEDFDFLFANNTLLPSSMKQISCFQATSTILPSSMRQISCFQELLILFWKLIDDNKDFLSYILRAGDINELVVPMLYFMYEGRKDPSKLGLIHICTFILLLLSGERNFCVNLNAAFTKKLPVDLPPFTGNHADLLYIVIHKLMTDGPQKLDTLYDCFMTTMSNVSPYIKTFCMPAALRAGNLFEMFGNKKRLLAHEQYPRYLVFCLEVFNNIIQYQYEGNPHFIYQILRRKKVFADLQELMESGLSAEDQPATPPGGDEEGKFRPTAEWVKSWASTLPLQPCLRIMQHLLPQLEQFCTTGNVNDETIVIDFLKTTTMVGLLPVPHPILIRKYQQNEFTSL
ncbi:Dymeclin, partial [Baffinella frigidus]